MISLCICENITVHTRWYNVFLRLPKSRAGPGVAYTVLADGPGRVMTAYDEQVQFLQ